MTSFLLMTHDAGLATAVEGLLAPGPRSATVTRCPNLAGLSAAIRGDGAPVAIVDLGETPINTLRTLAPLVGRHQNTRFVVLCDALGSALVLEAMRVGARSCIAKTELASELGPTVERLLADLGHGSSQRGRVVTVLAAKGGAGATGIALQLAAEMRGDDEALLVDLDASHGALSDALGLRGSFGVADVLSRGDSIDADLVRSTALEAGAGLLALQSPAAIDFLHPAPLDLGAPAPFLDACRTAYPITVVDAGRPQVQVAMKLAQASDATLIVFQLSVVDLKCTRRLAAAIEEAAGSPDKVVLVANRMRKRGGLLSLADARNTLGNRSIVTIANDYESMAKSLDLGKPIHAIAPRSAVLRDVRRLVDVLSSTVAPSAGAPR